MATIDTQRGGGRGKPLNVEYNLVPFSGREGQGRILEWIRHLPSTHQALLRA